MQAEHVYFVIYLVVMMGNWLLVGCFLVGFVVL